MTDYEYGDINDSVLFKFKLNSKKVKYKVLEERICDCANDESVQSHIENGVRDIIRSIKHALSP
jgi:hypothetical protein